MLLLLGILVLLVTAGSSAAQSSTCAIYGVVSGSIRYLSFPAGSDFLRGSVSWYPNNACGDAGGTMRAPGGGWARASSATAAQAVCDAALRGTNTVSRDPGAATAGIWICANTPPRVADAGSGSSTTRGGMPFVATGILLNQTDMRVSAVDGLDSGIQFQRVNQAGVGIASVLDMGYLDAVDVWAKIGGGYEVCFPQPGRIIFLDAATSPRTVTAVDSYFADDGFTCATMDRAGTLALVEGVGEGTEQRDAVGQGSSGLVADNSEELPLENCEVTARFNLRHRKLPAGRSLGLVPADSARKASARTFSWFKVSHNERDGWISALYVLTDGDCAYPED